ncbi:MAG: glycosyltransferase family 87 protein [Sphingomonas sp.]
MRDASTVNDCADSDAPIGSFHDEVATRLTTPVTVRARPGFTLAILLLVALVARAITFGDPVVHVDEEFYFGTAYGWLHGATPYVDIWDRKPIGLFIVYLPAAMVGLKAGIWAYQIMALASLVGTAWLIMRLAERAGWGKGALAGALAYILWVNLADGQGGQAPIFYNLLVIGAAALIVPRPGPGLDGGTKSPLPDFIAPGFAAMALIGLALQIKYSVVFEGLFFGLWLLWREWHAGRRWSIVPLGVGLAATALLPTAIAWFAWHRIGADEAWLYANLTSIVARRSDPALEQLANLMKIMLIAAPLIAASVLTWRSGRTAGPAERAIRIWLFAWLGVAAFGLLIFGAYFEHYTLPLLVPLSICASGFFGDGRTGRRIVLPLLLIGFLGGQVLLVIKAHNRGTAAQFASVVDAIGHGPGCLFVFSGESLFYPASGRCALTRYHFSSHLGRVREQGAIGVDQQDEIARILSLKPAIVVFRPAYRGERAELRAMAMAEMRRSYRLRATRQLGTRAIEIYARATP